MPEHAADAGDIPAPELPVTLDMPGKVADFLSMAELGDAVSQQAIVTNWSTALAKLGWI
ncbi:hypothetical protein [Streptomyces sp. NPDC004533]|uniref:hypothetical protein n=1 Tax=Streptomyces sp. NPDC004533 TaxID=3154278 RepID=UPI0033B6BC6C